MTRISEMAATAILALGFVATAAAQTAPPTLQSVRPHGAQRGAEVRVTIEGTNIGGITDLIFSEPGFSARIAGTKEVPNDVERRSNEAPIRDNARKFEVTATVAVAPSVPVGIHTFRVKTPLGVSNLLRFAVAPFPEIAEREPDSPAAPQSVTLPATIVGKFDEAGDADAYRFSARAGEELVFAVVARSVGSQAEAVLRLIDARGEMIAESNDLDTGRDPVLSYHVRESGTYTLTVDDLEHAGGKSYHYRISAGALPYITQVFPLGVQTGATADLAVRGPNIPSSRKVTVAGNPALLAGKTIPLSVPTPIGPSVNRASIALGEYPEVIEIEPNDDPARAQLLAIPSTVNGHIWSEGAQDSSRRERPDQDLYRFRAHKGQKLVFEVMAQRLGSPLDSLIDILDANGHPLPRATIRPVAETAITLNDPDANRRGLRIASWKDLAIDDYVMVGDEILQVQAMPTHPDADMIFKGFRGPRAGMLDTTPRNHAVGDPVYKVEIHPPGMKFPPNGMPVFTLNYINDDGGPRFGGKDSRLHFTAPEEGEFIVRVRDVRNLEGERFVYRLTVREPAPDFDVTFDPKSFNIPRGGRVSLTVTAERQDGFNGPIDVEVEGLPPGLTATRGAIPADADTTVLMVAAGETSSLEQSTVALKSMYTDRTLRVDGVATIGLRAKAVINGREVVRLADPGELLPIVALASGPDLLVTTNADRIRLVAGGSVPVTVSVERRNGFTGRVPISVMNLPHGVRVDDVGLNGVMITEEETSRTFHLLAEAWVRPMTQPLLIVGRVEVNSPLRNESAALPVELVIENRSTSAR
jgi:hypothetical protein